MTEEPLQFNWQTSPMAPGGDFFGGLVPRGKREVPKAKITAVPGQNVLAVAAVIAKSCGDTATRVGAVTSRGDEPVAKREAMLSTQRILFYSMLANYSGYTEKKTFDGTDASVCTQITAMLDSFYTSPGSEGFSDASQCQKPYIQHIAQRIVAQYSAIALLSTKNGKNSFKGALQNIVNLVFLINETLVMINTKMPECESINNDWFLFFLTLLQKEIEKNMSEKTLESMSEKEKEILESLLYPIEHEKKEVTRCTDLSQNLERLFALTEYSIDALNCFLATNNIHDSVPPQSSRQLEFSETYFALLVKIWENFEILKKAVNAFQANSSEETRGKINQIMSDLSPDIASLEELVGDQRSYVKRGGIEASVLGALKTLQVLFADQSIGNNNNLNAIITLFGVTTLNNFCANQSDAAIIAPRIKKEE